jgi:tripartite-type tricarboxylate transporter receptor subunit TctC
MNHACRRAGAYAERSVRPTGSKSRARVATAQPDGYTLLAGSIIWAGIFAPKCTPKEIIAKLAAALDKALDDPSVRKRLADLGGSIPAKPERTPASFARLVKAEIARWSPILKAASLTTH